MESYIFFMHSETVTYFVLKLPTVSSAFPKLSFLFIFFVLSYHHLPLPLSLVKPTGTLPMSSPTATTLFSLLLYTLHKSPPFSPPTLYMSPIFKAHMESKCFWVLRQCWMPSKTVQGFAFLLGFLDFVFSGFFNYGLF